MNTIYVRCPSMTTQSLHQQCLYHHRNGNEVFVQEQFSQREFITQHIQPTVFVNSPGPFGTYVAAPARPPVAYDAYSSQFAFRPTVRGPPPVGYYCVNGCVNAAAASSSGRYFCHPEQRPCPYPSGFSGPTTQESYGTYSSDSSSSPPSTYYIASQTQTTPIMCTDAATQSNMDLEKPAGSKEMPQNFSMDSENPEASSTFISMVRWAANFINKLADAQGERRNSEMKLPDKHMSDIIRLAIHGTNISEAVANTHSTRPCFKKIDSLCVRLKQDLLRVDGVLANINSQGIAWAVKDFIFLFTRIMSAWTILKSYLYNDTDGIKKIIDILPMGFMQVFNTWQLATIPMIDMVIQSIVILDAGARPKNAYSGNGGGGGGDDNSPPGGNRGGHSPTDGGRHSSRSRHSPPNGNRSRHSPSNSNRGRFQSGDSPSHYGSANCTPRLDKPPTVEQGAEAGAEAAAPINKPKSYQNLIDMYTMVENSEDTQCHVDANGTYLKAGTYQPPQKEQKTETKPTTSAFLMRMPPGFTPMPHLQGKSNKTVAVAKPKAMQDSAETMRKQRTIPENAPHFIAMGNALPIYYRMTDNANLPSMPMPDLRSAVKDAAPANLKNADDTEKAKPNPLLKIDPYVPCYGPSPSSPPSTPELETCAMGNDVADTPWEENANQELYPSPEEGPMTNPETIKKSHDKVDEVAVKELEPQYFDKNTKVHNQLMLDLEPYASMLRLGPYVATDSMLNIKHFMNLYSPINTEVTRDLIELKERVLELKNVAHFFQKQFILNYYPHFFRQCHGDFIDLREIILNCESGIYHHTYQAVHDLRRIVFVARCYLKYFHLSVISDFLLLQEEKQNNMLRGIPRYISTKGLATMSTRTSHLCSKCCPSHRISRMNMIILLAYQARRSSTT
ncbi:protein mitoshell isoform X1 [Drosophila miranda]|uniref:protein mitoshell isoform X1 n=1 Tax=Drosophila miranda TaxID=7229 RepID=UPI00143FABDD|nr:protein mitoshell isoform X1 [Drosophila miranda]